jgi:hypothetical protein
MGKKPTQHRILKGQSRMDNSETQAIVSTRDNKYQQIPPPKKTHTHTYRKFEKKVSNAKALKIVGEPWCWRRISSSCFLKETRRATYIVKSGKSLVSDIEKHRIYMKRKRSIAI